MRSWPSRESMTNVLHMTALLYPTGTPAVGQRKRAPLASQGVCSRRFARSALIRPSTLPKADGNAAGEEKAMNRVNGQSDAVINGADWRSSAAAEARTRPKAASPNRSHRRRLICDLQVFSSPGAVAVYLHTQLREKAACSRGRHSSFADQHGHTRRRVTMVAYVNALGTRSRRSIPFH